MKRKIILFILAFVALERFCYYQTAGFAVSKITFNQPDDPAWESPLDSTEKESLASLLKQPFRFLGKGNQCYAFASADGTTVIKFFKLYDRRPSSLKKALKANNLSQETLLSLRSKKVQEMLRSCKVACTEFKEETGLIYVHFRQTDHLRQKIEIIDKIGNRHLIEADTTKFIVQRRGELVQKRLARLMETHQIETAKEALSSLVAHIEQRCRKEISNCDSKILRNFAFVGNQPIEIDIGRMQKDPTKSSSLQIEREIRSNLRPLLAWLQKEYPELATHLEHEISSYL